MRSRHRLFVRIGLSGALIAGLLFSGGASALAHCETVWAEVYDVELDIERDAYRFGETAAVEATVTRKQTGTPVEDVTFVAVAWNKRSGWTVGYSTTDAAGKATAPLKLKRSQLKPGPVRLRSIAYEMTQDPTTCVQVFEYGEKRLRNAFTVKP